MSNPQPPPDPFESTQNDAESGSPSGALSPASPSQPRVGRGYFGKATIGAALGMELYQWGWGHAFDRAPWWGAPLALCLTMLPFGVWERLGKQAITVLAERLPGKR